MGAHRYNIHPQSSDEKYRLLFDAARDAIFLADAETGILLDCNTAAEELVKRTKSELIGQHQSILHPTNVLVNGHSRSFRKHRHLVSHELVDERVVTSDGTIKDVSIQANIINWDGRKVLQGIFRDITEIRLAEATLRDSENKYRALVETTHTGYLILDQHGKVVDANPEYVRLSGHSQLRDILGRSVTEWTAEYEKKNNADAVERCVRDGAIRDFVIEYVDQDGGVTPVEVNATVENFGDSFRIISLCRDITQRKLAEDSLKRSEDRYRTLFLSSQDALMTLTPPSWVFSSANPAALRLFGAITEEEFNAHPPWHYSPERQPDGQVSSQKAKEMIDIAMRDGHHFFEWTHKTLPGAEFFATVALTRMELDGELMLQAAVRDISEIKNAEKTKAEMQSQLFHSEKLATIGTLAAGVAHEINNPLAIVSGLTTLIENRVQAGAVDEISQFAGKQRAAVQRIADIVNGLRTFARTDTELTDNVDLHKAIDDTVALCGFILEKVGLRLDVAKNSKDPIVIANGGKLQQVLMNLLTNAKDAIEGRPAGCIKIESHDEVGFCVVTVSDNGCGMSPEIQSRIFDPFFTTKAVGKGTGLGLPIVKSILESFGGSLEIDSKLDIGSVFSMRVPTAGRPMVKTEQKEFVLPKLSGSVLVVDDEEGIREVLSGMLESLGLDVTTANDGEDGLQKIVENHFDFVVTDLQMPRLSGDRMIAEAKSRQLSPMTRFVVITGGIASDYSQDRRDIIENVADACLSKPFNEESLAMALVPLPRGDKA